jgi:hypothetical protein
MVHSIEDDPSCEVLHRDKPRKDHAVSRDRATSALLDDVREQRRQQSATGSSPEVRLLFPDPRRAGWWRGLR